MIIYQVFLNNIFQSAIQADSRQQAVALAHAEYGNMEEFHHIDRKLKVKFYYEDE